MKHTLIVNNIKQQRKSVYYPYLSGWRLAGIRRKMKNTVAHSHTRRTVRATFACIIFIHVFIPHFNWFN